MLPSIKNKHCALLSKFFVANVSGENFPGVLCFIFDVFYFSHQDAFGDAPQGVTLQQALCFLSARCLIFVSSAINPIIYAFAGENFRSNLRATYNRIRHKLGLNSVGERNNKSPPMQLQVNGKGVPGRAATKGDEKYNSDPGRHVSGVTSEQHEVKGLNIGGGQKVRIMNFNT